MRRTISIWLGFLSFSLLSTFVQVPATMGKIHGRVTDPLELATTNRTVTQPCFVLHVTAATIR